MTLGECLRRERIKQNKTLVVVAAEAKIAFSTLCDIEKGRHEPSLKTLRRLSKALGKPPSFFMDNSYVGNVKCDSAVN